MWIAIVPFRSHHHHHHRYDTERMSLHLSYNKPAFEAPYTRPFVSFLPSQFGVGAMVPCPVSYELPRKFCPRSVPRIIGRQIHVRVR